MPKFYIHAFKEVRVKYEVETDSIEHASSMLESVLFEGKGVELEQEDTEFLQHYLVDPVFEDGSVDYENSKWFGLEA